MSSGNLVERGILAVAVLAAGAACGEVEGAGSVDGSVVSDAGGADAGGTADLELNNGSQNFGTVLTDESSLPVIFTVSNVGEGPTGALVVELTGADAAQFAIDSDTCNGQELPAGDSCDVSVALSPSSSGDFTAVLSIASPGDAVSADLSGSGAAPGALSIDPDMQAFGELVIGSTSSAIVFTVTNDGDVESGALETSLTGNDAGDFSIGADSCDGQTLAGGADCTVSVTFSPAAGGAKTASLAASADPGGTTVSALSGRGLAPAELDISTVTHGFGAVYVGDDSSPLEITVSNRGGQDAGTLDVTLGGSDPGQFDIAADTCGGMPLAGGADCTVTLVYSPNAFGDHAATLTVSGSPGGSVSTDVTGSGRSTPDAGI